MIGIWRPGDASPAVAGQYGGWGDPSGRDGDEFPLVAFAQLLQGAALQAKLVALWAGTVLGKVERCQVAPAVEVLGAEETFSSISAHQIAIFKLTMRL